MKRVFWAGLSICVLAALSPTTQGQAPGAGRGQGNGPRTANRTIYTPKRELLATYAPFVVGQPSRVTAHLTKITDHFEAVATAKVTVALTVSGAMNEASVSAPDRSGVFRTMLTPTKAGTGTVVITVAGADGTEKFTLDNIAVHADLQTALANQPPNPDAGAIRYTKEAGWDSGNFATAPVGKVAVQPGRPPVVAVPRSAVVQEQGQGRVYVQRNPEAFDLKAVKTGASSDQYVEITEGVREGERVVVRGGDKMPRK